MSGIGFQCEPKNTNPAISRKAKADSRFIADAFKGKWYVGPGKGLSRSARRR